MIVDKKTEEWYNESQRVATNGRTSETNDNEWYNEWQRVTKNNNECQQIMRVSKRLFIFLQENTKF